MMGSKDDLVAIQRSTVVPDEYNEGIETWATIAEEWAAVFYGRGDERRAAAQEQGVQSANFQMWMNERTRLVSVKHRLLLNNHIWDIVGIAPDTPNRGEIEFTAIATGLMAVEAGGGVGQMDFSEAENSGLLALILEDA